MSANLVKQEPRILLSARAIEEAGHAVMAAFLRLSFSNVQINNNTKPGGKGGSVDGLFHPSKVTERYVRKHALVSLAGAAAQRIHFGPEERSNLHDTANVRYVYSFLDESKRISPFEELR